MSRYDADWFLRQEIRPFTPNPNWYESHWLAEQAPVRKLDLRLAGLTGLLALFVAAWIF